MIYLDKKKGIANISGMSMDIMEEITFVCLKLMEAFQAEGTDRDSIAAIFDGIKKTALEALDNPDEVYGEEKSTRQPSTMC